jgi:hypothetical protein
MNLKEKQQTTEGLARGWIIERKTEQLPLALEP